MSSKAKTVVFESVGEFLADACQGNHPDSHKEGDKSFSGTNTFAEAVALAEKGWPKGRERLEALRADLESTVRKAVEAKAATQHYDVVGDYIDVGRVLEGEPECCGTYLDAEEGHAKSKVVKLVANVSALGHVNQRQIFSLGAAIYAAIDLIESLGTRVELWLGSGSHRRHGDGKRLNVQDKIKDAAQPFEGDRLAFYLCNAASLRRLFFSVECQRGFAPSNTGTTHLDVEDDTVVTAEARPDDDTQARRIARVLETCEACGVRFSQEELAQITA
jgi:hypothetical protein